MFSDESDWHFGDMDDVCVSTSESCLWMWL